MKRIAVLMTCYNRVNVTLDCLEALFAQVLPKETQLDVFLVDDASPDQTGTRVSARYPQAHVIDAEGGLFWCKGMRLAWDSAVNFSTKQCFTYDFYLWLNDDVKLKDCSLWNLLGDYDRVGGVVVGTFSSDEREIDVSYGATRRMPDGQAPHVADTLMNGNMVLVPSQVYEKVGPICGRYHHQYGDYDYGLLIRRMGLEYYSSSHFCGHCPEQPERYFHLKNRKLFSRWSLLFNPKGYSLHDAFLYKYRNWGLFRALVSIAHVVYIVTFAKETVKE